MFLQNGDDVETLRASGNWWDYSIPLWYADSTGSEIKRNILNKIPKPKIVDNFKISGNVEKQAF